MSSSQPRSQNAAPESVEQSIVELLNYLLQRSCSLLPIKFADMLPFFGNHRASLNEALPLIKQDLKHIYGILFQEVPEVSRGSGKRFICTTNSAPASVYELTPRQRQHRTLLWIVLSYIFMRMPSVTEPQLQAYLAELKIEFGEHPYFGNVKKQLEETFVKQLYLKREKVNSAAGDEPKILYSWGPRAELEFSKKKMLNDAAQLMDRPTNFFLQQYNMVAEEEEPAEERDESSDSMS